MSEWIPLTGEDIKFDYYAVLFEGGTQGIASLTPRGWNLIEQSAFTPKDAEIVAYKHLSKMKKDEIKKNIMRGYKGFV